MKEGGGRGTGGEEGRGENGRGKEKAIDEGNERGKKERRGRK